MQKLTSSIIVLSICLCLRTSLFDLLGRLIDHATKSTQLQETQYHIVNFLLSVTNYDMEGTLTSDANAICFLDHEILCNNRSLKNIKPYSYWKI
jgi:hypothetical protein